MEMGFRAGERNRIIWGPEGHRLGGLEEKGMDLGIRSQDSDLWGNIIRGLKAQLLERLAPYPKIARGTEELPE